MTMYKVVHNNTVQLIESEAPILAAQKFSVSNRLRKGRILRVVGKRGNKERSYKVGLTPRQVNPHFVVTLPPMFRD